MSLPERVEIIEVGLRDGLQSEATIIPTEKKLDMILRLVDAGVKRLQVTSFVHPKYVPQMADAEAVCAGLIPHDGVEYSGLVLNMKGLERASAAGLRAVDMGMSASDTHSRKNTGMGIEAKKPEFAGMISKARELGVSVRAGLQCVFGCVYEGCVPEERIYDLIRFMLDEGIDELSLADSTGMAYPTQMKRMLDVIVPMIGDVPLVLHLHDTRGLGLANLMAALESGVSRFDTAFGGMGGCPFIKGATGNIATEDTLNLLEQMGIETGIDRHQVAQISQELEALLGKKLPGKLYNLQDVAVAC
ncbi:MAG: hydroxymethylglutaryl-CoA lyase [Aggregatilineales bacterium]